MCCNNNENCSCISEILSTILKLQKEGQCHDKSIASCDRPFLGTNLSRKINTRPVTFFSCNGTNPWVMPYDLNGTESNSTVFRIENLDGCCATFRVLAPRNLPALDNCLDTPYVATDSFFTMNLNCCGALQCLPDTYVECL